MTLATATTTLPETGRGGPARRCLVLGSSIASWSVALVFLGSGIAPGLGEPTEHDELLRLLLIGAGLAIAVVPFVLFWLPATRRMHVLVQAVLAAVLAGGGDPTLPLPPQDRWQGPERIFARVQLTSVTVIAPPLLLLVASAVAFGVFLGEPLAATVLAALALVPALFLVATWRLPSRLRENVRQGLLLGQAVPVRVEQRLERPARFGSSCDAWFDVVLPDAQHLTVRTPRHHAGAGPARGVLDAAGLIMVMGKGGHQGVLLPPSAPENAVWLLGPVPLTRVPRSIAAAFAAARVAPSPDPAG